jgi:hypothetical protein
VTSRTELSIDDGRIDLHELTCLNGEFAISERGWRRAGKTFAGELPHLVVTVENVGPFVDLRLPACAMLLFSQGTAVEGSGELLRALPNAHWVHFGDFDPAGLACAERLARLVERELVLYVPTFATEYLSRSRETRATWSASQQHHPVIADLARRNHWLEQECFVLDDRIHDDLWDSVERCGSTAPLS